MGYGWNRLEAEEVEEDGVGEDGVGEQMNATGGYLEEYTGNVVGFDVLVG
jgi:hypothetical protein